MQIRTVAGVVQSSARDGVVDVLKTVRVGFATSSGKSNNTFDTSEMPKAASPASADVMVAECMGPLQAA